VPFTPGEPFQHLRSDLQVLLECSVVLATDLEPTRTDIVHGLLDVLQGVQALVGKQPRVIIRERWGSWAHARNGPQR
jgi:hypothetical protein